MTFKFCRRCEHLVKPYRGKLLYFGKLGAQRVDQDKVRQLRLKGFGSRQIAKMSGISQNYVCALLKRWGMSVSKRWQARLDYQNIKRLWLDGVALKGIARIEKTSVDYVRKILRDRFSIEPIASRQGYKRAKAA